MVDSTFYAKLIFDEQNIEIDARPSDAIAIAVRCNAPIYVSSDILDNTGIVSKGDDNYSSGQYDDENDMQFLKSEPTETGRSQNPKNKLDIIKLELEKAIKEENYEKAAQLRDELKKFTESQ